MSSAVPPTVGAIVSRLVNPVTKEDADAPTRAAVATELAAHPQEPDVPKILAAMLDDSDRAVREAATASLAAIFVARPRALVEVFHDPDDNAPSRKFARHFFDAVGRSLAMRGTPESLDGLLALLGHLGYVEDADRLADIVAKSGGVTNDLLLSRLEATHDYTPEETHFLADVLARRGVDAGHTHCIRDGSRVYMDLLIKRGPDGIRALCRAAADPDLNYEIVELVGGRLAAERRKTEPTIREIVRERGAPTLLAAIWALAHWDAPEYVEALISISRDGGCARDVRNAALEALCELEAPEALETLCDAVADDAVAESTRWRCADALGRIGNAAGLPALEAVAKEDPTGTLGDRAREAIRAIRDETAG